MIELQGEGICRTDADDSLGRANGMAPNGRGWKPVDTRAGDAQHRRLRSLRGPGGARLVQPAMSSDKLFDVLFHSNWDLILRWLEDLRNGLICRRRCWKRRSLLIRAFFSSRPGLERWVLWVDWSPKARCDASAGGHRPCACWPGTEGPSSRLKAAGSQDRNRSCAPTDR